MKKLTQKLNAFLFELSFKAKNFAADQRGVSPIIATVLTILIAVLLAGIFWTQIQGVLNSVFKGITDGINKIK